jgi:hypothetical protein
MISLVHQSEMSIVALQWWTSSKCILGNEAYVLTLVLEEREEIPLMILEVIFENLIKKVQY